MSKEDFIAVFEATLLCANLDVIGLSLADDSHAVITLNEDFDTLFIIIED